MRDTVAVTLHKEPLMNPTNPIDPNTARMIATMMPIFWAIMAVVIVVPFWRIFKKAGMSPALSLLMVLPLINLIMLYVLAFSHWKTGPEAAYASTAYPPAPPSEQYPPKRPAA